MRDDDAEFEELRGSWKAIVPPPPDDGEVPRDATTRSAVAWLSRAWQALPVPPPSLPRTFAPVRRRLPSFVRSALAASVLLAASFLGFRMLSAPPPPQGSPTGERDDRVAVIAANSERIELRSGPVRLVLLMNAEPGTDDLIDSHKEERP